jgi:hypothetical protein
MLVWVHDIILGGRIKPLYLDTVCENGRPLRDILQVFSRLARASFANAWGSGQALG